LRDKTGLEEEEPAAVLTGEDYYVDIKDDDVFSPKG
jgi:hypothetical protein